MSVKLKEVVTVFCNGLGFNLCFDYFTQSLCTVNDSCVCESVPVCVW